MQLNKLTDKSINKSINKSSSHKNFMRDFFKNLDSPKSRKPIQPIQPIQNNLDKPLEFTKDFAPYFNHIQEVTNIPILDIQKTKIENIIKTQKFYRLTPEQSKKHRKHFNKVKESLRQDWENHTHMKWKTYDHDVISEKGKVIRFAGQNWDAHEIILNSWNSPHQWWNITPAPTPEHQNTIHGNNSPCNKIFG